MDLTGPDFVELEVKPIILNNSELVIGAPENVLFCSFCHCFVLFSLIDDTPFEWLNDLYIRGNENLVKTNEMNKIQNSLKTLHSKKTYQNFVRFTV